MSSYHSLVDDKIQSERKTLKINDSPDLKKDCVVNNKIQANATSKLSIHTEENNTNDVIIIELDNYFESNYEKKKIGDLNRECILKNDKRIKTNSEQNERTEEKNKNDEIIELDNDNESNCQKKNISDLNRECNFKNNKGIKTNSEQNQYTREKHKSSDEIIVLDNNNEGNCEKTKITDFNEEFDLNYNEEMEISSEESQHSGRVNENESENIQLDKSNGSIGEKKKIPDLIKKIKNGEGIKTRIEQNQHTKEKTEDDKNIYIIELVDCNEENIETDNLKANNISLLDPVKQNKKIVGKGNIKLNLCRKRSDTYNEEAKKENNEIIELDDDDDKKNKKLDTDIIEIDDEGDDEELYKDIIEAYCEDSGSDEGIVVIYDRNETDDSSKSLNKEIIDLDDDKDQDKNRIDKDQYKIQRVCY